MPNGLPTAAELLGKEVTFFSIDTNIIQGAGYKYDSGALQTLPLQRPPWITLQLTEVVAREVMAHRMKKVSEAARQLNSSSKELTRLVAIDMTAVDSAIDVAKIEQVAEIRFSIQLNSFLSRFDGVVLPIDGANLAKDMFTSYFNCTPPFESRKKEEFPDAAALLVLEQYAKAKKTMGILISTDKGGWEAFAAKSDHLYCVKTLEEFTAIFESKGTNATLIVEKVRGALSDPRSALSTEFGRRLGEHISDAYWVVDDIYSDFNLRLEGDVVQSELLRHDWDSAAVRIWVVENDPTTCVVELNATVEVSLSVDVQFFQRDWVDRDEIHVGSQEVERTVEFDVEVLLTCTADLLADQVDEWDISVEVAGGDYSVDVGQVNPDFNEE